VDSSSTFNPDSWAICKKASTYASSAYPYASSSGESSSGYYPPPSPPLPPPAGRHLLAGAGAGAEKVGAVQVIVSASATSVYPTLSNKLVQS
jgi:hypothetical protein